jgi:carboxylesterase
VSAVPRESSAPFAADNGASGVLVLHGFTGSPHSMRPLADAFDRAGFSVELPLLPGHGTEVEDLAGRSYGEWLSAAESAYARLSARGGAVVVCGMSMGGTLSLDLALRDRQIGGLILINPMVAPPAPSLYSLLRAALDGGNWTIPSIGSDIAMPGQSGGGYDKTPIAPLLSLFEATETIAPRLSEIDRPALLFSSRSDHVVPTESSDLVERDYGGPLERVVLERSYHVATLDFDAEVVTSAAVAFAEKVTGG